MKSIIVNYTIGATEFDELSCDYVPIKLRFGELLRSTKLRRDELTASIERERKRRAPSLRNSSLTPSGLQR